MTRKICDFFPKKGKSLTSIVWLYRGQEDRFAGLMQDYLSTARDEAQATEFAHLPDVLREACIHFAAHTDATELQAGIEKQTADAKACGEAASALVLPNVSIETLIAAWTDMQP